MKLPSITVRTTRADFPEQDWSEWRNRKREVGETIDGAPLNTAPCCILCGTWVCMECYSYHRSRASRSVSQYCSRCGGRKGHFVAVRHTHRNPHELPLPVPFIVPRMRPDDKLIKHVQEVGAELLRRQAASNGAFSLACPAGDPCPATGCPSCCPSYDPCNRPECDRCKTRKKRENMQRTISDKDERKFWGLHKFQEAQDSICCGHCGWGFHDPIHIKEKKVHVPGEAELFKKAVEGACNYGCTTDKGTPDCRVHNPTGEVEETDLDECDWVVRHATLETPDEYCGLPAMKGKEYCPMHQENADALAKHDEAKAEVKYPYEDGDGLVLGPEVFTAGGVISWKGENYYRRVPTDKDRELIAQNAKATIKRRDAERRAQMFREQAMQHAVDLHKASLSAGDIPARSVTQSADDILAWLIKGI